MADVTVTLAARWDGHQIGDKVRVSEVLGRQLRRGGIAEPDPAAAKGPAAAKKAAPAKAAAHKPAASKPAADEKPSGDSA